MKNVRLTSIVGGVEVGHGIDLDSITYSSHRNTTDSLRRAKIRAITEDLWKVDLNVLCYILLKKSAGDGC